MCAFLLKLCQDAFVLVGSFFSSSKLSEMSWAVVQGQEER